ncbi:DUF2809 domain-containing protein [Kitasatospora cinereorecta]|uniref:DUF2809 domain-containing protein n=1 Tax=Kitasatospora cinereorecta TaxID=285560 RepID=A0ABW0VBT0_9ACTN
MTDTLVLPPPARVRLTALAAAVLTVAAGLAVTRVGGGESAKVAGDCLYTVLLHTLITAAAPRLRPRTAGALALGLSWCVEFAQLTGVPADLARHSLLARLVLGTTFNTPDLLWYAVAAGCTTLVHAALLGRAARG